jgi:DNA-binding PadR family transcriptional regulator
MDRLEKAGYVEVNKSFNGRIPHTEFRITPEGSAALTQYWQDLDAIRGLQANPGNE